MEGKLADPKDNRSQELRGQKKSPCLCEDRPIADKEQAGQCQGLDPMAASSS